MIDISRAKAITGFMIETELQWLAEQAQRHNLIAEIGSYLGRSTRALGDHAAGTVIAIDDWKGPRHRDCDKEQLLKKFYRNLKDLIERGIVTYHRWDHTDMPEVGFTPDFVFIDGDHDYENVKRDILFWKERIAPGGLLSGHDYPGWPGVRQAVDEVLPQAQMVPKTSIWFVEVNRVDGN